MIRARSLSLFVPLALAVALVGCSSSDDAAEDTSTSISTTEAAGDTTTTEAAASESTTTVAASSGSTESDEEICASLKVLSDYDGQSAQLIAAGDWPAIQKFFVEQTQTVIDAYDRAIATGSDLTAELTQLRDITDGTSELAASSTDLADFGGKLAALPGLLEAGQAGLTLNTFAESTCGFSTGGAGN